MALFGMATKYAEAVLAVNFREETPEGEFHGGPMYYIQKGLGQNWTWLAMLFALFATIAAFGIGNMVQSNSVADALHSEFSVPEQVTGHRHRRLGRSSSSWAGSSGSPLSRRGWCP